MIDALRAAKKAAHKVLHSPLNSKKSKADRNESITISFNDLKWACGHIGPAVCKTCWDNLIEERNALKKELGRQ